MNGKNIENIVHRQHFQNSANTVEVIIRSKPKEVTSIKKSKDGFSRNCALKTELDKRDGCEKENIKESNSRKYTNVEIYKKKKIECNQEKKVHKHKFLSADTSWGDFFDNIKESKSISLSSNSNTLNKEIVPECAVILDANEIEDGNKYSMVDQAIQTSMPLFQEDKPCSKTKNREGNIPRGYIPTHHSKHYPNVQAFSTMGNDNKISNEVDSKSNSSGSKRLISGQQQRLMQVSEYGTSEDQTHSPFGASALLLFERLKERLRSRGDSESSDIVEILEAFINGKGNLNNYAKMDFKNKLNFGSLSTPSYPPVFATPKYVSNEAVEKLNMHIDQQNIKIEEYQQTVKELKELSARLLSHHEEQMKQIVKRDSLIEGSSGEIENNVKEYEKIMKTLKLELDSLTEENGRQKDLIFKLEVKLSTYESRQGYCPPNFERSNNLHSNENINYGNNRLPEFENRQKMDQKREYTNNRKRSIVKGKVESDIDSAFDERFSSRGTSKLSRNFGGSAQHLLDQRPLHSRVESLNSDLNLVGRVNDDNESLSELSANNVYPYGSESNPHFPIIIDQSDMRKVDLSVTYSGYTTHDASVEGVAESGSNLIHKGNCNQNPDVILENKSIQRGIRNESTISDSPIVLHADKYLESTHVREDQEHPRHMQSLNLMSSENIMEPMEPESTRVSY